MPLIQANIDLNKAAAVQAVPLDWRSTDEELAAWREIHLGAAGTSPDLIIASDCTYNPTYFRPLCGVISRLQKRSTVCLLAKKHRHQDEEQLWDELARAGLFAKLIAGEDPPREDEDDEDDTCIGLYIINTR